jgi:histidine triad (HIT) family protein
MTFCVFCAIIDKKIPAKILSQTPKTITIMDINPLSKGHCLVIPKKHTSKMDELDDESLAEVLPAVRHAIKGLQKGLGVVNYNIIQNNGKEAHQEVDHVHYHIIPKYQDSGLGIKWVVNKNIDVDQAFESITGFLNKE